MTLAYHSEQQTTLKLMPQFVNYLLFLGIAIAAIGSGFYGAKNPSDAATAMRNNQSDRACFLLAVAFWVANFVIFDAWSLLWGFIVFIAFSEIGKAWAKKKQRPFTSTPRSISHEPQPDTIP